MEESFASYDDMKNSLAERLNKHHRRLVFKFNERTPKKGEPLIVFSSAANEDGHFMAMVSAPIVTEVRRAFGGIDPRVFMKNNPGDAIDYLESRYKGKLGVTTRGMVQRIDDHIAEARRRYQAEREARALKAPAHN